MESLVKPLVDISVRYIDYLKGWAGLSTAEGAGKPAVAAPSGVVENIGTLKLQGQADGVGQVDYSFARRWTLQRFQLGLLSRLDVCDAHPDLLRAARYAGDRTWETCPICEQGKLMLVSYVFSEEFSSRENGKVWTSNDLTPLLEMSEVRLYRVEVCIDCSWNHVRAQLLLGKSRRGQVQKRGRRAST